MRCPYAKHGAKQDVAIEVVPLSDVELAMLVLRAGPSSIEARVVVELCERRAKDRQVYAFRVGEYYFTGPTPDAETEIALVALAEDYDEEE